MPARKDPFAAFRAEVEKRVGKTKARVASKVRPKGEVTDSISTGMAVLDHFVIGDGGFPCRRMTEVASEEGLGKSSLLLSAIAQAQQAGAVAAYFETERRINRKRMVQFGVDLDKLLLFEPKYLEALVPDLMAVVESVPKKGAHAIVGWDSIAATPIKAEVEEGLTGPQANRDRARMIAQTIRSLAEKVADHNVALVLLNQVRKGSDAFGGDIMNTMGGDALRYYATVRMVLLGGKAIKRGTYHIGKAPVLMTVKNLIVDPFRKARAFLVYNEGWSDDRTLLEFGKDQGLLGDDARMGQANLDRVREILDLAEWDPMKFEQVVKQVDGLDKKAEEATKVAKTATKKTSKKAPKKKAKKKSTRRSTR